MKEKPETQKEQVSVVITHYNLGKYLLDAVGSVLRQTFKNFEIIVVDDGSDEADSIKVIEELIKQHPKIKLIRQKNCGLSTARNKGIEKASGEYIICLDADDKLHPKFLEKTIGEFNNNKQNNVGVVTTWLKMFDQKNEIMVLKHKEVHELLLMNALHVASMFKKTAWKEAGGYKSIMKEGYEDWEFWISIVEAGYDWVVFPEVLFYYRVRKTSMITESRKLHKELVGKIFDLHKKLYIINSKAISQYSSDRIRKLILIEENLNLRIKELNDTLYSESVKVDRLNSELSSIKSELNATKSELISARNSRLTGPVLKLRDFMNEFRHKAK